MKEELEDQIMEQILSEQIPEAPSAPVAPVESVEAPAEEPVRSEAAQYLGTKLGYKPGDNPFADKEGDKKRIEEHKLTKVGQNLFENAEYREGWIDVDRSFLGERAKFYPEDWRFKIRPATVEAIRNWSTIDEENVNSIDDVFNEVMKSCISIQTPNGPLPWGNINSWDRFFFLLLVREYTFIQGETAIKYDEDCIECENPITFQLTSQSLMYEYPDEEVMSMYEPNTRSWHIDPAEYEVNEDPITLYLPTLEKDANIKAWLINRLQENRNRKIDQVFLKFLPWMAPKISKDTTIAARQIKELEMKYKSWDTEMFSFVDEVIRNIAVSPLAKLTMNCPICGEEVTSQIRFPNSVKSLFNVQNRSRKFGKK